MSFHDRSVSRGRTGVVRQRLLMLLAQAPQAMSTADLRRGVSKSVGQEILHERVYQMLEVLEHRGAVARTARSKGGGRDTLWALSGDRQSTCVGE